jgi:hypothetical protein
MMSKRRDVIRGETEKKRKLTNRRTTTKAINNRCKGRRSHCTRNRIWTTEGTEMEEELQELGEKKNWRKRAAKIQEKESQKKRQMPHLSPPQGAQPPSLYAARVLLQYCEHVSLPESQLIRGLRNVIVQGARHTVLQHTTQTRLFEGNKHVV